ncbi:MAG: hypothetical protein FD181_3242 [Prolixibacteraceae bacterium]|nr:MAG: hypothetical protein FD181_3242 [Prolixibacteraceae bacterium]
MFLKPLLSLFILNLFIVDSIIHYCVANMPGAVPRTSTIVLLNATLPNAIEIAAKGWKKAYIVSFPLQKGLNVVDGKVDYKVVT